MQDNIIRPIPLAVGQDDLSCKASCDGSICVSLKSSTPFMALKDTKYHVRIACADCQDPRNALHPRL